MAAPTTRSKSLSHFRRILKEVHLQYTHPNELTPGKGLHGINVHANKVWTEALKDSFRKNASETDPVKFQKLQTDGEDLAVYLESQRQHKELVERYNPAFWDEEKGLQVDKTAKMVGFEMPSAFDESQKDEELVAPPRYTYTNKGNKSSASTEEASAAATETVTEPYKELEKPEEPKKRTYMIPKAFGFADQAQDDLGRAGDRKIK
ncbi:hypothetical protein BGZ95_001568 [Linnemannia exigua]|uniref:Uncharacterized protein n=1 Tax=Linnemannia exigua TaxID=604196 RepID=A0AAD4H3K6_9FUNG|nr:hypothetical protein BGZ95_001568 [Linnemannia exigua]